MNANNQNQEYGLIKSEVAKLENSMIPIKFVEERYPKKWDHKDFVSLREELLQSGISVPNEKLNQYIQQLHNRTKQPAVRHTRKNSIPTIEQMQTPTMQATASWADGEDFGERYTYEEGDFFLGRSAELDVPLGSHDQRHVFMTCASRSGKGTGIIIPNHLLWKGPLISLDPKGENATIAASRRGMGNSHCIGLKQRVCVLDPMNKAKSIDNQYRARFNPLEELDLDDPECIPKSAAIADGLVVVTGKENIDYFSKDAKSMLHALILHIISSPHFDKRRNLGTLRELVIDGDQKAYQQLLETDPESAQTIDSEELLFSLMMGNPTFEGEISGAGRKLLQMRKEGKAQWAGVSGGMRIFTDWLRDKRMKDQVSKSDFKLSEIKSCKEGMSIFICLPERNMETYNGWQRSILNLIAYELQETQSLPACGERVLMCLDEFAALGKLSEFERGIAYFAGYGVKLLVVLQNFTQIQTLYDKNWEAFLGNSSAKLFYDLSDITTPDTMSKYLGEVEMIRYAESQNVQVGGQQGMGIGHGRGTQQTQNQQISLGGSYGEGENQSDNHGESQNWNENDGKNWQNSHGNSKSSNYDRNRWLRNIQEPLAILRKNEKRSLTQNDQSSQGGSQSKGKGGGISKTHSDGNSSQWTKQHSMANGNSLGETDQTNLNANMSESISLQAGVQQQFQKRALALPNELRQWLARIEDESHPYYPGLALLLVNAEDPVIIRRVNYYEYDLFEGLYDPDPNYPSDVQELMRVTPIQIGEPSYDRGALWVEHEEDLYGPVIHKWYKKPEDKIRCGEKILEISPGATQTGLINTKLPIYAPISGYLDHIIISEGEQFKIGLILGSIRYHLKDQKNEEHITVPNEVMAYDLEDHAEYWDYIEKQEEYDQKLLAEQKKQRQNAQRLTPKEKARDLFLYEQKKQRKIEEQKNREIEEAEKEKAEKERQKIEAEEEAQEKERKKYASTHFHWQEREFVNCGQWHVSGIFFAIWLISILVINISMRPDHADRANIFSGITTALSLILLLYGQILRDVILQKIWNRKHNQLSDIHQRSHECKRTLFFKNDFFGSRIIRRIIWVYNNGEVISWDKQVVDFNPIKKD